MADMAAHGVPFVLIVSICFAMGHQYCMFRAHIASINCGRNTWPGLRGNLQTFIPQIGVYCGGERAAGPDACGTS